MDQIQASHNPPWKMANKKYVGKNKMNSKINKLKT